MPIPLHGVPKRCHLNGSAKNRSNRNRNRPVLAVAAYNGLLGFEYAIVREVLGIDRSDWIDHWYSFVACRVEPGRLLSNHGLEIRPEGTLEDLLAADIVLIPGWRNPSERPGKPFLNALRAAYQRRARFVSICTGVFPLAYAGLLSGRTVTTHWLYRPILEAHYPEIRIDPDALYVHDDRDEVSISTSAGSSAGLDLCLALIREDYGVKVANKVARRMVAPVHRDGGQSQYVELNVEVNETGSLGTILEWLLKNLAKDLKIEKVARRFGYSERSFQRKFQQQTGMSPHQWLVRQRIAKACELLETTDKNVDQIAGLCGLGSAANLRKHLTHMMATTPRAYRAAFRAIK